ncbi:NAD(P)-dependent oxidoreductase [Kurthia sibirica]|uniref:NAD(P)-binding domain-containing protein n=1 Tax=Kurthia sibirica TaxID=202750 RepID=A0A2U3AQ62_9BACL|nr:NAD(P)H-binding protein [Kurthia sibirica]PWI26688.1 hypothetical protein DEX24_02720 [Kurthia sibirica]GEK32957.1 hypothetical protein KSI01_04900 [Kurthia sibirica]
MKIAILGATGRVGAGFLELALSKGHSVKALMRKPTRRKPSSQLEIIIGDAKNQETIATLLKDVDVVFSALNTDQTTTLTEATSHLIEEMTNQNITRIVTIGTAGILESRAEPGKLRYLSSESRQKVKFAANEHAAVYRQLKHSSLQWTIICPTALINGKKTGIYRYEKDYLPTNGMKISVLDTAALGYEAAIHNLFLYHRVGIAY